ncbi:MAG: hypothetical protein WCJ64_08000, partial [Rhodospirillaceae bacterium]
GDPDGRPLLHHVLGRDRRRLYDGPQSLTQRLVRFLEYLDRAEPAMHWGDYLNSGHPRWKLITASGQSQGAGMSAFIAKEHPLERVILFSAPIDFQKVPGGYEFASWLTWPSKTPMDRWYAGYNVREPTANKLASAYQLLGIPDDHIRKFTLEFTPEQLARILPEKVHRRYHGQGIGNPAYKPDWLFFLGVTQAADRHPIDHGAEHSNEDDDENTE